MSRRKLAATLETNRLSPQEQALVDAASTKPHLVAVEPPEELKTQVEAPPSTEATVVETEKVLAPKPTPKQRRTRAKKEASGEESESDEILISDSFKLRKSVQERLLKASLHRKLERTKPYTKQDIVNVALDEWLEAHEF